MKYKSLIIANLFRKKLRTTLTIGSFAVALFLFRPVWLWCTERSTREWTWRARTGWT